MSEWQDTPDGEAVLAERLDGERVRYYDLRPGDIFRAVDPVGGTYIDPFPPFEPSDALWRVKDDPRPSDGTECCQEFGWCMAVEEVDPGEVRASLN